MNISKYKSKKSGGGYVLNQDLPITTKKIFNS